MPGSLNASSVSRMTPTPCAISRASRRRLLQATHTTPASARNAAVTCESLAVGAASRARRETAASLGARGSTASLLRSAALDPELGRLAARDAAELRERLAQVNSLIVEPQLADRLFVHAASFLDHRN